MRRRISALGVKRTSREQHEMAAKVPPCRIRNESLLPTYNAPRAGHLCAGAPMAKRSAKLRQSITALAPIVGSLMATNLVHTAELTVLAPQALKPALSDLIPQFERSSGNQVTISYSSTSALVTEIQDGKMADLAILFP